MTSHTQDLRERITRARYVLFDFDGPVCRLFAGHAADGVSRKLVGSLEARGLRHLLSDEERNATDPLDVLRAVHRRCPGSDLMVDLEELLTQEELRAASSAKATDFADLVVRTWAARGARLAVTTNNSSRAVRKYLESRGLDVYFAKRLYGRTADPGLLKPDPYCLKQALAALDADPVDALMVGDAPSDLLAAQKAGVSFLGYARNGRKEKLLRDAGAEDLVLSMDRVLSALRD
ncbi:HAD-IA family hydrolase [Streptomyces sp. SID12501]|uniref:HAD family hydrolase n=1 Tax=Streptomyces sp. SID12501 TaxID=2706042 RepID=A0A6B3C2N6_9ACTN|nr:HAD family hydrolase [Streptomyces sp. SID12501]